VPLIAPGAVWGDYLSELDLRLSKRIRIGSWRFRGDLNLYNVFNSDFASTDSMTSPVMRARSPNSPPDWTARTGSAGRSSKTTGLQLTPTR